MHVSPNVSASLCVCLCVSMVNQSILFCFFPSVIYETHFQKSCNRTKMHLIYNDDDGDENNDALSS